MTTASYRSSHAARLEIEYRGAPRHRIIRRCHVRPLQADGSWRGIACSISATGIGVVLPFPIGQNTVVEIKPEALAGAQPLFARVVYSAPFEFLWLCGCKFMDGKLEDEDLRRWLAR